MLFGKNRVDLRNNLSNSTFMMLSGKKRGDEVRVSGLIYQQPEIAMNEILENQQTVRVSKLRGVIAPLLEKVEWQGETLEKNIVTIRKLNERAQKAEVRIRKLNEIHELSSNRLHNRAQIAENLLERARREIAGLKMDARIANGSKR